MRLIAIQLLLFPLLQLLPTLAQAGDGLLEISQACAVNAGCVSGDTPGFPVTIDAPGSYVLTSNLTVSGTESAIAASVAGVQLDLNGFQISGPVSCTAAFDQSDLLTEVTCTGSGGTGVSGVDAVSNGSIRGFGTGIGSPSSTTLRVHRVSVTENSDSGVNPGGRGLILTDSVAATNQANGVEGQFGNGHYTIRGCVFERNGDEGVYLDNGVVTQSLFHQNHEGIRSNVGGQALAVNNSFTSNVEAISGGDVAYRSNVFADNGANPSGGDDLGANICDGSAC